MTYKGDSEVSRPLMSTYSFRGYAPRILPTRVHQYGRDRNARRAVRSRDQLFRCKQRRVWELDSR